MADEQEIEGNDPSAVIANEIRLAEDYYNSELAGKRANAIHYLRGELPDVLPRPNGSVQTSRDFSDAVSWVSPGIIRVFTASDRMVEYDKVTEENDDWSRDATDYMNYTFMRESPGYHILVTATQDALVLGNGVVCSYWEPPRVEKKTHRDKTPMQLVALMQEEGWKPVKDAEPKPGKPRMVETDDGEEEVKTLTVKLQKEVSPGKICDIACKPENLRLNSTATSIEDARFVAYQHEKTRSDLMEMADDYKWSKADIEELPSFNTPGTNQVQVARDSNRTVRGDSPFRSGDPIPLHECYLKADIDGDGIAELIQAWYAGDPSGGTLLGYEEWDGDIPYTDIPCYPVPHRYDAESLYDRTADIMQVKTVLTRQALDNLYAHNLPMREVDEGSVRNPDILVNPKFGGVIWKKAGSQPIQPHLTPFVADKVLQVLTYMDEQVMKRTGISRQTMALDPEALQNQTATAAKQQHDASVSQVELIARNMAELGWTPFFKKRLKLAIKHGKVRKIPSKRGDPLPAKPRQMPPGISPGIRPGVPQMAPGMGMQPPMGGPQSPGIRPGIAPPMNPGGAVQPRGMPAGAPLLPPPAAKPELSPFRTVDPRQWDPHMAVTINTGLGTGSHDRDMAMLNVILSGQIGMADRLAAGGMKEKAIEFIPKIRNTAVRLAESAGLKNPEEFYPTFDDEDMAKAQQIAAQPPEPTEIKVEKMKLEAQGKLKQMEMQSQGQLEQAKMQSQGQLEQMKMQAQGQLEQQKVMSGAKAEELKAQGNAVKERAQMEADLQVKDAELRNEVALEQMKLELEREKLAQQWDIEVMKLNAITVEEEGPGPDGKPKPKTKRKVVDATTTMLDAFNKLGARVDQQGAQLQQLAAYASAPTEIVRGPDGRATGARKVMN